jgi:dTDP-L-rhamnose 4-epimerase
LVFPSSRTGTAMARGEFEPQCPRCGAIIAAVATDEAAALQPQSVYGVTKLTQEQLVLSVARALGISGVALRYQNVYGPGQSLSNPYTGILSIFSTRIRNGRSLNIFEDGDESRDFVYVDDAVVATLRAIEFNHSIVDTFNVGSGVATTVSQVATSLQEAIGIRVPTTVSGQFRVGDIRHNVADLGKIRRVLDFVPQVTMREGLLRFVAWVTAQHIEADGYEASLEELRVRGLFK